MKITFLGAARTVTGSCYLLETKHSTFLIDCGMFQGEARELHANSARMPFRMEEIDFMLLSHAHIDHSGRIPKLWKDGLRASIYATKATVDLCGLMLPDSGHIQEMEHEWRNRKNARAGKPLEEPLYTVLDAQAALGLFESRQYDVPFSPAPDISVTFRDAGHVLGSAITELRILEDGKEMKVVFTGDLGNTNIPIMRDPTVIDGADLLIMETTYGNRLHDRGVDKVDKLVGIVNETIRSGGNVVIPSFAVGRTQEIIYEINRQIAIGKGADQALRAEHAVFIRTPVVVDSPLAISATEVFRNNEDCFDAEAQEYIRNKDNPLDFPNLSFSRTKEESMSVNADMEPKIIIASSGMCDAGRIRHHLKHNLWRPESTILFVGYQAPGTLGRQLMDGAKEVTLFGEDITVNARVESIEGFSGHADQEGLLNWFSAMKRKPAQVLLVHGEPDSMKVFAGKLSVLTDAVIEMPEFEDELVFGAEIPDRRSSVMKAAATERASEPETVRKPETERKPETVRKPEHDPGTVPVRVVQARHEPTKVPDLAALQEDFLAVLSHHNAAIRQAAGHREREHAAARAREWEQDVRRSLERYRRSK